ncbi:MAG: SulP family inorganic anion transporter [Myxococcota bacterium]
MSAPPIHEAPKTGWAGFKASWRNDLRAGFVVSLVALRLSVGIAVAGGAPPMAGLLSAIAGGLLTTFFRGSHIGINGPGNVLIVITLVALETLGGEGTFATFLAASVIAGALQVVMGLARLGKVGHAIPGSVIHGMLAAIGVIILSKQLHVAIGREAPSGSALHALEAIPESLLHLNPFVACIGVFSLLVILIHPRLQSKFIHFIPAPLWVLILSVPAAFLFDLYNPRSVSLFAYTFEITPKHLIQLPPNLTDSLIFPDFSRVGDGSFWIVVALLTVVLSVEDLAIVKAVEKLDPYRRPSNLNRDLIGIGLSTVAVAFIGGLPVITVIARSSVNANHGAKTSWSNFAHGGFLLAFVLLLPSLIQLIPLAALAAILVYTGYQLTSPQVFQNIAKHGYEQLLVFCVTIVATLVEGILTGIIAGMVLNLVLHLAKSGMAWRENLVAIFRPTIDVVHERDDNYYIRTHGLMNFLTLLPLRTKLNRLPEGAHLILDFHKTQLVDHTILEFVHDFRRRYQAGGGGFDIIGLDVHQASSNHPTALHTLARPERERRLTQRQKDLRALAQRYGWTFDPTIEWDVESLSAFQFFETRPIEYQNNVITGELVPGLSWQISDITFDEGALHAAQVYHTTIGVIHLPTALPQFTLEKEAFFDRLMEFAGYRDIDFKLFPKFSSKFLLKGDNEEDLRAFFTEERVTFFEQEEVYHIESRDSRLLIFRYLRLGGPTELERMVHFCRKLVEVVDSGTNEAGG